jgi:hypothetical protein
MKKIPLLVAALGAAHLAHAAAAPGPKARLFAKYDANKNGLIDGAEVGALRKDFEAAPKGELARFDTDRDGKLSDEEIAALRPPGARSGGEKKGGGRKKADGTAK